MLSQLPPKASATSKPKSGTKGDPPFGTSLTDQAYLQLLEALLKTRQLVFKQRFERHLGAWAKFTDVNDSAA